MCCASLHLLDEPFLARGGGIFIQQLGCKREPNTLCEASVSQFFCTNMAAKWFSTLFKQ